MRITTILSILSLFCGRLNATQAPDTLGDIDLSVAKVPHGADTSEVRRVLGPPLRIIRHDQANDDGVRLVEWVYRGLRFAFDPNGSIYEATVTTRRYATARNVRVGDSFAVVRHRYGQPAQGGETVLLYPRSRDDFETLGITFFFEKGILKRIILGEVISVE